jgi:glycosyltransferase involved in cell wall biosynthesis
MAGGERGAEPARLPVVLSWAPSGLHGWGIYGLNLALHWAGDPDIEPLCAAAIDPAAFTACPGAQGLERFLQRSGALATRLAGAGGGGDTVALDVPVLAALRGDLSRGKVGHGVDLTGRPTIGVAFFETPQLNRQTIQALGALDHIVVGSTWNEAVLRAHGVTAVTTVMQGIDPAVFYPAPAPAPGPVSRPRAFAGRFAVFSGGKIELRKGQDIVLAAFRAFAATHDDAVLVTAWHSPWPQAAVNMSQSRLVPPVPFGDDGAVDVRRWAAGCGLRPDQVVDLGAVPQGRLAAILRDMDVAVFSNRCEGGTNLVAMECMACGLPVVLSRNTGHLDIIADDACYTLDRQSAIPGAAAGTGDVPGWGESQVDELVAVLEAIRSDPDEARRRGAAAARRMAACSWRHTAARMKEVVMKGR